jgi:hypothetical protein
VLERFRIDVLQAVLDDLAERLARARLPERYILDGGEDAARLERIGRLYERWRDGYDWRAEEARITRTSSCSWTSTASACTSCAPAARAHRSCC